MINFSLNYQNHIIQIDLNDQDTEALTKLDWKELYQNAQNLYLPYYWLSIAIIKDKNTFRGICYDGSTLEKLDKLNQKRGEQVLLDPLTRSPILTIHYIFFNCFKLTFLDDSTLLKPLNKLKRSFFSFDDLEENSQLVECAKASLNSLISNTPTEKKMIGKIQFTIGCKLLNCANEKEYLQIEGIRWLVSASKQGISEADTLLMREKILPISEDGN